MALYGFYFPRILRKDHSIHFIIILYYNQPTCATFDIVLLCGIKLLDLELGMRCYTMYSKLWMELIYVACIYVFVTHPGLYG